LHIALGDDGFGVKYEYICNPESAGLKLLSGTNQYKEKWSVSE